MRNLSELYKLVLDGMDNSEFIAIVIRFDIVATDKEKAKLYKNFRSYIGKVPVKFRGKEYDYNNTTSNVIWTIFGDSHKMRILFLEWLIKKYTYNKTIKHNN